MQASSTPGERNWTTASVELLTAVLPRYGGRNALNFLAISPLRHGELLQWRRTSSWWCATWTWYKMHWEITWHDLSPDDRVAYGLQQPIWFHSDAALHYEKRMRSATTEAHRRCLGMVPEPQRSFRLHISRVFGLRSLSDFRLEGEAWPIRDDFVQRHIDFTHWQVPSVVQVRWLRTMYREATQIVERLGALSLVRDSTSAQRLLPHFGCVSGTRSCLIPAIPRSSLLRAVWQPAPPTKPQPMAIFSPRVDEQRIKAFVEHNRHLRKILLPIFDDLQFRLAFRLLPVRSRFWFLEASHPGIRLCARDGCNAIETKQHLFFDCTLASQLWWQVLALVTPMFAARPCWLDIALAPTLRVRNDWEECADVARDAWHVLRSATLHMIWTDRNRCLFDARQPLPTAPALAVIFTTTSAHVRRMLRIDRDRERHNLMRRVLSSLALHQGFGDFAVRHPNAWCIRKHEL